MFDWRYNSAVMRFTKKIRRRVAIFADGVLRAFDVTGALTPKRQIEPLYKPHMNTAHQAWIMTGKQLSSAIDEYTENS